MGIFVDRPRQSGTSDLDGDGAIEPVEISRAFAPLFNEALARKAVADDQERTNIALGLVHEGTHNLVNERARTRGSGGNGRGHAKGSTVPQPGPIHWWRVFVAMAFLTLVLFAAYSLEGSPTHTQTRDVLFNIVQVGFPGLLALLGIETTKNG